MLRLKYFAVKKQLEQNVVSSKSAIPTWYKKIPQPVVTSLIIGRTVKRCMPFLDSLTSGYLITTNQDIELVLDKDNNYVIIHTLDDMDANVHIQLRDTDVMIPAPFGYSALSDFVWTIPFTLKTPKGYSLLMTHPFNRYDLPFVTTSGIVDSDKHPLAFPSNIPFFLQFGWTGLIPAGTPIAQLIPIKRKKWQKKYDSSLEKNALQTNYETARHRVSFPWYKNVMWRKKDYS